MTGASGPGIRGACASASLKLCRAQLFLQPAGAYPRRMRLGLIEARKLEKTLYTNPKQYPRRMRLGLIEALFQEPEKIMFVSYPRRMRLGLIEARRY